MAVPGTDIELITGGVDTRSLTRGSWAQNVWRPDDDGHVSIRSGFGQVSQLNTTLTNFSDVSSGAVPLDFDPGYQKHLGSHTIQTDFGTTQVISAFHLRASSGEGVSGTSANIANRWGNYYSVSIVDVDTGETYEEVLHNHTSQNRSQTDGFTDTQTNIPSQWHGCYETNEDYDRQNFVGGSDAPFFFLTFQSGVLFGNESTGIMSYFPVDFRVRKDQQVETAQRNDWVNGRAESSLVSRLVAVDGVFSDGFVYRSDSGLPAIKTIAQSGGRLVIAGKNELYFSDPGTPNSFISTNFIKIPTSGSITAVAEVLDNLMVFTENETFFYQPSIGAVSSDGNLLTISKTVGCIAQSAVYGGGTGVFWVDNNGIYSSGNGMSVDRISDSIDSFFGSGVTSPLNHYLTNSGISDPVSDAQPRTLYKHVKDETISVAFWQERNALFVCFSGNKAAWVLSGGEWSIWPFESSMALKLGAPVVGVTSNIDNPFILQESGRLFMCGGVEIQKFIDGNSADYINNTSYYLLEYGKGGGLDRSVKNEDTRSVMGYWKLVSGTPSYETRYYIGKPTYNHKEKWYEIPIDLVTGAATNNPTSFNLSFDWDDANFSFLSTGIVPTERLNNRTIYSHIITPAAGNDNLALSFSVPAVTNTTVSQRNPWYILVGNPVGSDSWGYGINNVIAAANGSTLVGVYVWQEFYGTLNADDSVAQPVDWAYKGQQVSENNAQIQARGLYTSMVSRGSAKAPMGTGWLWGLFNTLLGSDWKDWSTQVVDYEGPNIEAITNKLTIRSRFKGSSLSTRTFDDEPQYGTYLIDDEEFDTMATSDSVRGETISYMMFGFIRNKAEGLRIRSSKMLVRFRSRSRRRGGR